MIADLKPYPVMRNSGVPWLGAVPTHWRTHPVRRYCRVFAGATPSRSVAHYWENGSIPWLSSGDVNLRRIRTARQFITDAGLKNSSANWIRPGSLVVALAGQGKTKGMVATVEVSTTCNQSLAVIEPADSESRYEYLAYYLESRYQDIRALVGDGLRDGLNLEHVRSIPTPLPPLPEQAAIVRFLDHADRRIRRYIRAKQQLIALLEEQKQAIINQAVTGQIDVRTGQPYLAYKDSDVEWLGQVPEHWEVSRVKTEFHNLNRRRIPLGSPERGKMTRRRYDYYGASGVIDKVDDYLFDDELLLIAEDGANLVLRNLPLAIVARGKFWVNNHAHVLKPRRGHLEFLAGVMESFSYLPWISGAAQPKLTQDRLMGIAIAVPPSEEQDRIASFVATETSRLCIRITRAKRQIDLLQEYRARLIADVVTGKLDVRGAATTLPEVVDPLAGDDVDDPEDPDMDSALEDLESRTEVII